MGISVTAANRHGLLSDITQLVAAMDLQILAASGEVTESHNRRANFPRSRIAGLASILSVDQQDRLFKWGAISGSQTTGEGYPLGSNF